MNAAWNAQAPLPVYAAAELARLDFQELIDLLIRNEDRVPRALVDECARRGDAMVERLATLSERKEFWKSNAAVGEWWLALHAAMILGLIASESAGLLLVRLMRHMAAEGDKNLQDWLAGYWPALFANKPPRAVDAARELAEDRALDWYIRCQGIDVVVAAALRDGRQALEASLDWVAAIAADESEDWDFRASAGNTLLDFPRERHRVLLEDLAERQSGWGVYFSKGDVEREFDRSTDEAEWLRFADPWMFYTAEEIARRQERWAEEDAEDLDEEVVDDAPAPYVRAASKIGRNDPCPCGSGEVLPAQGGSVTPRRSIRSRRCDQPPDFRAGPSSRHADPGHQCCYDRNILGTRETRADLRDALYGRPKDIRKVNKTET